MNTIENIYSLTPLQQGLLFHSVLEPQSRVYQPQLSLRLNGRLDPDACAAAWRLLLERHAVLRTALVWEDLDDAYQVVHTSLPLPLTRLDWRGRSDVEAALRALEAEQRQMAFDLSQAPLLRLCLVQLADDAWQLIWTHHHLILDGWSEALALRDWLALYRSCCRGEPPRLASVRPFQDYIAWLGEQDMDAAMDFWRSQLHDLREPTPLPETPLAPPGPPYAEQSLLLPVDDTQRLVLFARQQRVTLNTVIQAAWGLLLGRCAGRDEALFGVTLSGRPEALAGAEDMVGVFINTLPLRLRWQENPRLGDWLRAIQDLNADLRHYQYTPLARLRALSGVPGERPLFESILVFESFPIDQSLETPPDGLRVSVCETAAVAGEERLTQGRNNYPLTLVAVPGESLELTLAYARRRFYPAAIRRMLGQLRDLLLAFIAQAGQPVQAVDWLSDAGRRQLLDWGRGETLLVPPRRLHQWFEEQADAAPEAIALSDGRQTLSYRQLDEDANRLAHRLIAGGVRPGQPVAIALERSAAFVIAVLATLKAGACYLPLDIRQPPARLARLLADSGAGHCLCRQGWQRQLGDNAIVAIALDDPPAMAEAPASRPQVAPAPDPVACLIYTSGSTGAPKGVAVGHQA
nr:condensation domain-containing protein [Pseudomonadota bacterium]